MAMASSRCFSLFPLLLHSRSSSSFHLFRRLTLTTRHCPHLFLSPPNPIPISPSPFLSPLRTSHQSSLQSQPLSYSEETPSQFPVPHGAPNPWPEWLDFVNWVSTSGFCNGSVHADEFVQDLPLDFLKIANGCLDFARQHPNILWSLPREDIEVVIYFGSPFLFKDALGATRRMKSFLGIALNDASESDKPSTVDLMRFLLSYAHMAFFSSENKPMNSKVESCVRKLLGELVNSRGMYADSSAPVQNQFAERHGQAPRSLGKNIEMKRRYWICPRCTFMNFMKNLKCPECEDPRPKKYVTGAEWECPQCNFFNFSRNAVCLRCDCKKAEQHPSQSPSHVLALGSRNSSVKDNMEIRPLGTVHRKQERISKITELEKSSDLSGSVEISEYLNEVLNQKSATDMSNIDMGLDDTSTPVHEQLDKSASEMENEEEREESEKSERWFRKVSEVYDGDDKDFTETMPMRKGENCFVVSKKKDRSLTSPMYKRRMAMEQKSGNNNNYVPFVPFPADYFAKEDKPKETEGLDSRASLPGNNDIMSNSGIVDINQVETQKSSDLGTRRENENMGGQRKSLEGSAVIEPDPLDMSEEAKAERWFKRVAQIKDISELSEIPDEDFPSIMPMRKGVNRFVVSKRKTPLERRLTSSQYRRNLPVVNSDTVKKETDSS